jgi:hypothetical protein
MREALRQLYWAILFLLVLVGGAFTLDAVAEAGSAQTFIRQHFVDQPTEDYCNE